MPTPLRGSHGMTYSTAGCIYRKMVQLTCLYVWMGFGWSHRGALIVWTEVERGSVGPSSAC